jgi:hypothetical protein
MNKEKFQRSKRIQQNKNYKNNNEGNSIKNSIINLDLNLKDIVESN